MNIYRLYLSLSNHCVGIQILSTKMLTQPNLTVNIVRKTCRTTNSALINGYRKAVFLPGIGRYTGKWKDNLRDGFGTLLMGNGTIIYEGDWKNDKRHGFGILKSYSVPFKNELYNGEWKYDQRHGEGTAYLKDGTYEGEFKNNCREGLGIMWFSNGSWYIGEWKMDLFDGVGVLVDEHRNMYQGYFQNGVKSGEAILKQHRTSRIQNGIWVDGYCVTSIVQDEPGNNSNTSQNYTIPEVRLENPQNVIEDTLKNMFKKKEQLKEVLTRIERINQL